MMEKLGAGVEANIAAKYVFLAHGFEGVVLAKIGLTLIVLFTVHMITRYSKAYWSVNGFLIALAAGGVMAANANVNVLAGEIPWSPVEIIFTYILLVLLLIEIGSFMTCR